MSTSVVRSARRQGKTIDQNSSQEDGKILKKKTKRAGKNVPESEQRLPGAVVHDILVKFSTSFVHNCRLVNTEWRDLILRSEFVVQNFQYSEPQLILQCATSGKRTHFDVKKMKFNDQTRVCKLSSFDLPKTGLVRPSCHGLLLTNIPNQPGFLRVLNPVTKKHFTLPRFPSYCPHKACAAALVFDPFTKVFKVVHMYTAGAGFEILTLLGGQEIAWKRVFLTGNAPLPNPLFTWRDPLVSENGRFLHWNIQSNEYILSMDIVEEKPIATRLPDLGMGMMTSWRHVLLEMDGCVAVVCYDSVAISIWVLKDFRDGVWEQRDYFRVENISFADGVRAVLPPFRRFIPVGGMENGNYLVFKQDLTDEDVGLFLYVYDINAKEIKNRYRVNMKMKNMESLFTYRSSLYHWNTFMDGQVNTD